MALILLDDLHLYFGPKRIFDSDNIAVEPGDKLGIVGPNGAGKSTLLKIFAGVSQPDSGQITRAKGLRVGYLPQELSDSSDTPLLDSLLLTAPGKTDLENALKEAEHLLSITTNTDKQMQLSEKLADLHGELSELEQNYGPHRAQAILGGLGFTNEDFSKPLSHFSGGWRMRAALATLLYQRPDVLLLDEPTNHLDLPSVHWLSNYLRSVKHALVLTCHDREFLNRQVNRIASLELDGLKTFRGNYDEYRAQRTLQMAHLEANLEKQAERKKQLEAFVDRFKAKASKARQAQSRAKMIERLEAEHVDLPQLRRAMHIKFSEVPKCAERVMSAQRMSFAYSDEKTIFSSADLEVRRGDRISIVGVNGAGKTTLLRLIAEELHPQTGHIERGRGVELSYFAQHHSEALSLNRTILEEVRTVAPEASETRVRSVCGAVLFTGDDVNKPVSVLSGGEKARVALAKMLIRPANLLLLDEPTNHLDTDSAEVLTESLESFDGTILFVSHNLDFARKLSTKVWDVSNGKIDVYPGGLQDYLNQLETHQNELQNTFSAHALEHQPSLQKSTPSASLSPTQDSKEARIQARTERKKLEAEHRKQLKKLQERVTKTEQDVARLEEEKAATEQLLSSPEVLNDTQKLKALSVRFAELTEALDHAMESWSEAEAELETLQAH